MYEGGRGYGDDLCPPDYALGDAALLSSVSKIVFIGTGPGNNALGTDVNYSSRNRLVEFHVVGGKQKRTRKFNK